MTIRTNASVAGATFLIYIAAGISSMLLAHNAAAVAVLGVVTSFCAIVLGVTLWAITREQDRDLATLAMLCRVVEAVPAHGEIYFAVASTIFSWLLLQGRMIPAALAWLGVLSSSFLVVLLLVQQAGLLGGPRNWSSPVTWFVWLPMLVFELSLATWLITKGVALHRPIEIEAK